MSAPSHRTRCAALGLDAAFVRRVREAGADAGVSVTVAHAPSDPAVAASDVVLVADGTPAAAVSAAGARAVVVCIAHGDAEGAARVVAAGADDAVTTRTPPAEVAARLATAAARRRSLVVHGIRRNLDAMRAPGVLGRSPAIQRVREMVSAITGAEAPVRIHGEPGTGKTLIARTLHGLSARGDAPLLEVDAARLLPAETSATLLGIGSRPGAIEVGGGTTILVRSVDRLEGPTQHALARWLRTGTVPPRIDAAAGPTEDEGRTGGHAASDARLVVTSTDALDALSAAGRFRPDLAAALAPVAVRMPPLRERPGDATLLLAHFLHDSTREPTTIDAAAARLLESHHWPGNVAEVRALAVLLAARSPGAVVGEAELVPLLAFPRPQAADGDAVATVATLEDVSFGHIVRVLALCGGARGRAAKALGISPRTIYNHLHGRPGSGPGAQAATNARAARPRSVPGPAPRTPGAESPPARPTSRTQRGTTPR